MFKKSTLLSTVASVTLIGSILALAFMAAPAVAADGPTYVFRLQQKLLTPPVIVADADSGVTGETDDTGGTGSDTGSDGSGATEDGADIPQNWFVITFRDGFSVECPTAWTPEFVTAHLYALKSKTGSLYVGDGMGFGWPRQSFIGVYNGWFTFYGRTDSVTEWNPILEVSLGEEAETLSTDPWKAEFGSPCIGNAATLIGPLPVREGLPNRFQIQPNPIFLKVKVE